MFGKISDALNKNNAASPKDRDNYENQGIPTAKLTDIKEENLFTPDDLDALNEEIREKLKLAEEMKIQLGRTIKQEASINGPTMSSESGHYLKPKDVIAWVSTFDGSGNVRIFIREVQDALDHMNSWIEKKCVLRQVIASRLTGAARDLIGSQEADNWEEIKDLLHHYYDTPDVPYTHLKEQRNKTLQGREETVSEYARRFLNFHRKVIKAAGNKTDALRAKYAQEAEEEEGVWRFTIGLSDRISERVENKNPRTIREAISLALNAESLLQERDLCRRMASGQNDRKNFKTAKGSYTGTQNQTQEAGAGKSDTKRTESLYCNFCRKKGHTEDRCYAKNRGSVFRAGQRPDRPPPVRALQESDAPQVEDSNCDPYGFETSEASSKFYTCDQSEYGE